MAEGRWQFNDGQTDRKGRRFLLTMVLQQANALKSPRPMLHATAPVLFESTGNHAVLQDRANDDWVALLAVIAGDHFETLARRYYLALYHFRKQRVRPALPGRVEVEAQGKQQALHGMLKVWEQRKADRKADRKDGKPTAAVFVDAQPAHGEEHLPESLRDFSKRPPALGVVLTGPGRPPCDALCLLRAFLAAPLLGVGDGPSAVYRLLHSNPAFAYLCGFLGGKVLKQTGELTSRRLPSSSLCEEFSEVMTRYGLWQLARLEQVRRNIATGVVEVEDTASFDTTHIEANSHCANVVPHDTPEGGKQKSRRVPRMRKHCSCGRGQWESCEHPWVPTDHGAAVVVKGPTRIYWAHKASVAAFGDSEIPFDVRVCQYAATSDGDTLVPHLHALKRDLPAVLFALSYVLADSAYKHCDIAEHVRTGARLLTPVHGRKAPSALAENFEGIDRFTPSGVPICKGGQHFEMRGRDITNNRYIWAAPDDDAGKPVCQNCPLAPACLKGGQRRHIRLDRKDQPQIDWCHPQHFARNRSRYERRTGVERAIKRLKIDLAAEVLTHRDAHRVQAHLDRKLLTVHLLLEAAAAP